MILAATVIRRSLSFTGALLTFMSDGPIGVLALFSLQACFDNTGIKACTIDKGVVIKVIIVIV